MAIGGLRLPRGGAFPSSCGQDSLHGLMELVGLKVQIPHVKKKKHEWTT